MEKATRESIERLFISGNHLASLTIQRNLPEYSMTTDEFLDKWGPGEDFDIWFCWKRIMEFRDQLDKDPSFTRIPPSEIEPKT